MSLKHQFPIVKIYSSLFKGKKKEDSSRVIEDPSARIINYANFAYESGRLAVMGVIPNFKDNKGVYKHEVST